MNTKQLFTTHSLADLAETAKKLRADTIKKENLIGSKLGDNYLTALDICQKVNQIQQSLEELNSLLYKINICDTVNATSPIKSNPYIISNNEIEGNTLTFIDEAWTHQINDRYLEAVKVLENISSKESPFADTICRAKSIIASDYVQSLSHELSPSAENFDQIRIFFGEEINKTYLENHRIKILSLDSADSISNEIIRVYSEYTSKWNPEHGSELDLWVDQLFQDLASRLESLSEMEIPFPKTNTSISSSLNERWKMWAEEVQLRRDQNAITSLIDSIIKDLIQLPTLKLTLRENYMKKISSRIVTSEKTRSFWIESIEQLLTKFSPEATQGLYDIEMVVTSLLIIGFIADLSEKVNFIIQTHLKVWFPDIFKKRVHLLFPPLSLNIYPSPSLITFFYSIFQGIRESQLMRYEKYFKSILILLSEATMQAYLSKEDMGEEKLFCDMAFTDKICLTNHFDSVIKEDPRFIRVDQSTLERAQSNADLAFCKLSTLFCPFISNTSFEDSIPLSTFPFVSCSIEGSNLTESISETNSKNSSTLSFKERHTLVSQASMSSIDSKSQASKSLLFTEKAKMLFTQSRSLFSTQ